MKSLKEPLSRLANRQDKVRGAFFEQRYKSVAVLDEESLLATCAYIDLNPVAAGIVEVPEESPHTSVTTRVDHVKAQGRVDDLKAAERGSVAGSDASAGLEETIWLCPVEDRRKLDSSREGMVEGLPLGSYLLLVDYSGACSARGRARFRPNWGEFSLGWARARKAGRRGWRSSGVGGCWADSSQPVESGYARSPHAWVCTTWPTWVGARRDSSGELIPHHGPCPEELDAASRSVIDGRRRAHNWPLRSAPPRSDGVCSRCGPRLTVPARCARPSPASLTRGASA